MVDMSNNDTAIHPFTASATTSYKASTAALDLARQRLAKAVADGISAEDLARHVNAIATIEGEVLVWDIAHSAPVDRVIPVITDHLVGGARDTWSGRVNDVRRAIFDGFRQAAGLAIFRVENTK